MKRSRILTWLSLAAIALSACSLKPVEPQPGATITGKIEMGDKAEFAQVQFTVTPDGGAINNLTLDITNIKCEGFSAGKVSNAQNNLRIPITEGKFDSGENNFGSISGEFTSPTEAKGVIHIVFKMGMGGAVDCGVWNWSSSGE
jgi:hypothetical protein